MLSRLLSKPSSNRWPLASLLVLAGAAALTLTGSGLRSAAPGDKDPASRPGVTRDVIDYPFVDDPALLGRWQPVDFVTEPDAFIPGKRQWQGELQDFKLAVDPGGKTKGAYTWTNGLLIHRQDHTAARYEIRTIQGQAYLFFQWKNGDYLFHQAKPHYYVMGRLL